MARDLSGIRRELSLAELAEKTGCTARTIRFYIAKGLLAGPVRTGRGAFYSQEHVERICLIRRLQAGGLTLAEIAHKLAGKEGLQGLGEPTAWWSYQIQPDVIVQVRADVSPWRLRQIKCALREVANRLARSDDNHHEHSD